MLYALGRVILILAFAMFFAYLLAPPVHLVEGWLRSAKMPRGLARGAAIGVVYVVLTLGVTLVDEAEAKAVLDAWMSTPMRDARDIRRLLKIRRLEDTF